MRFGVSRSSRRSPTPWYVFAVRYPDLGTSCPVATSPRVRAVGWLAAADAGFPTRAPDPLFANGLAGHIDDGWRHVSTPPLECAFCEPIPGVGGEPGYILVPAEELLFVAPSMILHFVINHRYAPPAAFCAAVMACPTVATDEYYAALGRFLDVFGPEHPLSREELERSTREHRERVAAVRAERAERTASASGKRRTTDG